MVTIVLKNEMEKGFAEALIQLVKTQPKGSYEVKQERQKRIPALDEAIAEYERGETTFCKDYDEYLVKIDE